MERELIGHPREIANLERLLQAVCEAGTHDETVSVEEISQSLGRRAFGPVLVVVALPSLTPIPVLQTVQSIIILLTGLQMVAGMQQIWVPRRFLRISISRARLRRMVERLAPVARFIDRLIRPRLDFLTREPVTYGIGALCCLLALIKLPLELIPFTSGIPGLPVLLFGLAIMARDGALVIITVLLIAAGALGFVLLATLLFQ